MGSFRHGSKFQEMRDRLLHPFGMDKPRTELVILDVVPINSAPYLAGPNARQMWKRKSTKSST